MHIIKHALHSESELIDCVRRTSLRGNPRITPFKQSLITIKNVCRDDIVPTQEFILESQLAVIKKLYYDFRIKCLNLFNQRGFISFNVANDSQEYVLTPPIVEVVDGVPLLIDGQHRVTFADNSKLKFTVLFIENIPREFYPYQLEVNGGWNAVQKFRNRLPRGFVRKDGRYPDKKRKYFFREYPFPGIIKLQREHTRK